MLSETTDVPPDMVFISTHIVKCSCETKPVSSETHSRGTHGRAGKEVSEEKTNIWLLKRPRHTGMFDLEINILPIFCLLCGKH